MSESGFTSLDPVSSGDTTAVASLERLAAFGCASRRESAAPQTHQSELTKPKSRQNPQESVFLSDLAVIVL